MQWTKDLITGYRDDKWNEWMAFLMVTWSGNLHIHKAHLLEGWMGGQAPWEIIGWTVEFPPDELTSPPSFLISHRSLSLPDLLACWTSQKITDSCKTVILDMTRQSFTCHLGLAGSWSRHCFWWRECTSACCMRFGVSLCYHAQMDRLHATVICYNGAVLDNHCMLYSSIRVSVF